MITLPILVFFGVVIAGWFTWNLKVVKNPYTGNSFPDFDVVVTPPSTHAPMTRL